MSVAVEICNNALIRIGAKRISDLSDDTKEGRLCDERYFKVVKHVLREHPWNFAIDRVALAEDAGTTPEFDYARQFDLPSDCIRMLSTDAFPNGRWALEGRKILSDESAVEIRYVKDVSESPHLFDDMFKEAVALKMASEFAKILANSNTLSQQLFAEYRDMLSQAKSVDGQEGQSIYAIEANEWIDTRW
jgi:hypothetical protein